MGWNSVLVASFGAHNAEQYTVMETNQLVEGIIKDIAGELVDKLDIEVLYIQTPRKLIFAIKYLWRGFSSIIVWRLLKSAMVIFHV